jgi:type I restriction enzyme M protein
LGDDRFSQYGRLAPSSKADWAFIQHMIHHLAENGTMAVVAPHGILFRGGAEGHIRRYLIEDRNYLDAVVGLPSNIFYGTNIPTCVLVFKKCRENFNEVLIIDASRQFKKTKNQNYLREEDIDRIVKTYAERSMQDKYSYAATLDDIKENEYNLNIPRYVDTFEPEDMINLNTISTELKKLEVEMNQTDNRISNFCDSLGISTPF